MQEWKKIEIEIEKRQLIQRGVQDGEMFRIEENRDKVAGEGGRYKNKCSRYKGFLDERSDEGKNREEMFKIWRGFKVI